MIATYLASHEDISATATHVGKGLSRDDKARKHALQHWLEDIDPRHRYGHNLQFYYVNWLQCHSKQPGSTLEKRNTNNNNNNSIERDPSQCLKSAIAEKRREVVMTAPETGKENASPLSGEGAGA
ncbi:unnamed protein product [Fraxinus pennsylvanica]|uniref:Uncharacterized protein n=1 Tax=Fraxinus pennsylvanica TaxID=56036 RepID=A0AAD1Z1C0_9LAMI|nr:unnamed protein product [Fraxinus pennsylvanica]